MNEVTLNKISVQTGFPVVDPENTHDRKQRQTQIRDDQHGQETVPGLVEARISADDRGWCSSPQGMRRKGK